MSDRPVLPIFAPVFSDRELEFVSEAVKTGWISSAGPFLSRFEQEFATRIGVARAETVSSGTAALHVLLAALSIGPDDEVIVPSQTFVATAAAVRYCGARAVFADILRDTWNIDPDDVLRKLTPRTRAVIPVDLFGLCADIPVLRKKLAEKGREDVAIVEDAAQSFGSEFMGVRAGALGDAATFSFYGNKTITTGEGGMVTTARTDLADRVRFLKNHSMIPEKRYYHPELGFNFRMTNLQAAIGLAQLSTAEDLMAKKCRIHARYRDRLAGQQGLVMQVFPPGHRVVPWLTMIVDDAFTSEAARDAMMRRLLARGIDSRPMFYPNHLMPPFTSNVEAARGTLPVTEDLAFRGIGLPSGAGLTDADVDRVVEIYLEERRV
jgi:perosamine synthetase